MIGEATGTSTVQSTAQGFGNTTGIAFGSCIVFGVGEAIYPPNHVTPGVPFIPAPTRGPLREYWLRTRNGQLEGPYTYYEAETRARVSTREAARTGRGDISKELVTVVGTRQGDPRLTPSIPRVVCVYLAGRKTIGGDLAQYNHNRGNT